MHGEGEVGEVDVEEDVDADYGYGCYTGWLSAHVRMKDVDIQKY